MNGGMLSGVSVTFAALVSAMTGSSPIAPLLRPTTSSPIAILHSATECSLTTRQNGVMGTWAEFEAQQPTMARRGRDLMYRSGDGEGMLVSVREAMLPRIHPVNAGVVDGHLYTFVQAKSAKRRDLDDDGRYAFHTHIDPQSPSEFSVRGRAVPVADADRRARVAADWFFTVRGSYRLYELLIEHALLGERPTAADWPPVYTSWSSRQP
jgi:hypothetical protein